MPAKLSVNINAIAMLRNRRNLPWPSITRLGAMALEAGASGLTVHPRPDQRHIRFKDVPAVRALIDDRFAGCEFNIEGFPNEAFLALAIANEPEQVTLVPDDPAQPTSDHGWDFIGDAPRLKAAVSRLRDHGIRVSLFANPDADGRQLDAAIETGAQRIEIYTGPYGGSYEDPARAFATLEEIANTAFSAKERGLGVNAGHDLTVQNLPALVKAVPHLAEVSIGHALTADALEFGMAATVKRFLAALQ